MLESGEEIRVFHVDDDPDFAEMTATFLEREDDRFDIETATSAGEGLDRLSEREFDCIVSDYDMPGQDGIAFLERVREEYPDLPFILFTGKGSEEIASEAISKGVTDYLQKGPETDQYTVLANRIVNAVERHVAEQERQQWKRAVETATEGIAILDEDGRYLQMNEAYAEAYGRTPEELIGKPSDVVYPDDVAEWFEQEVRPALRREGTWKGEAVGCRADGTRFEQQLSLAMLEDGGHVCVMNDITEHRQREQELQRMERIIQEMDDGVVVVQDQTITYTNPQISEIIGYPAEDLVDEPMGKYIAPEDRETVRRRYKERLAGNEPPKTYEISLLARDGGTVPVEITAARVTYGGEDATVSIVRDISDRKERIRELERQNERLEEFASIVSHDLRNPLNVASARLELAQETSESPHLEDIADAHERMERLIDDLLTLARQGEQVRDMGAVSVADLAKTCWGTVETAGATLEIETDLTIRADRTRLKQAVENLIRNAVEHGGPEVTVRVGALSEPSGFYVADDGPGIPEDSRDEVFESGYSTADDGTGFGLAIVREIVEAHDWEISLTDSGEGGARFEVSGVTITEQN